MLEKRDGHFQVSHFSLLLNKSDFKAMLLDGSVSDACASNVASVMYQSLVNRRSLVAYVKFFQKC